jgi:hypothetical protein
MQKQVERANKQSTGSGAQSLLTEQFNLPPLPGGDGLPSDSSPDPSKFAPDGEVGSVNRGTVTDTQIMFQPLIGTRQLSDAEPMKNMFLKLSTNKLPVLFSTMTMVENGASNGYFAALNATNNVMQGTMQAHNLQMNLLSLTDHTGVQTQAYLNNVNNSLVKRNSLPAAIVGSLGDRAEGDFDPLTQMPTEGAFSIKDIKCANAVESADDSVVTAKLSDLLFCPDEASDKNKTAQLSAKKADFIKYLGDCLVIETYPSGSTKGPKSTRLHTIKRILPEGDAKGRSGLARAKWQEHAVVFEALGSILRGYCIYRTSNENWNKGMWDQKKTPSMILREDPRGLMRMGSGTAWEYASAPDMPLTEGFVDQLFLHVMNTSRVPTAMECDALAVKVSDMPTSNGADAGTSVNDCKVDKGCLRNRLLLYLSDLIARSRAYHLYALIIDQTDSFATTPEFQKFLGLMLKEQFKDFNIREEIYHNLTAFNKYKELQAKFFQGQIGGSSFLANMDSNSPQVFTAGRK